MQHYIMFRMKVKRQIPEALEFVIQKMVIEKMVSYCCGDETESQFFGWWCEDLTVDKARGLVLGNSDTHMDYEYISTFKYFIEDLAENIPGAEFSGSIEKANDDLGTEITIEFKLKKGKLEFEEVYPEGYDEWPEVVPLSVEQNVKDLTHISGENGAREATCRTMTIKGPKSAIEGAIHEMGWRAHIVEEEALEEGCVLQRIELEDIVIDIDSLSLAEHHALKFMILANPDHGYTDVVIFKDYSSRELVIRNAYTEPYGSIYQEELEGEFFFPDGEFKACFESVSTGLMETIEYSFSLKDRWEDDSSCGGEEAATTEERGV